VTPGDTSTQRQVFEYDALSEELVRVSIGGAGYAPGEANANASQSTILQQEFSSFGFHPSNAHGKLAVSADGSAVVFESQGALTAGAEEAAAQGANSVYTYRSVGSIANGNVYLVSDGKDTGEYFRGRGAVAVGLDASGRDVFFLTSDHLLPQDTDLVFDMYDARVGGGFPAPTATTVCEGEACQGAPLTQPQFGAPGSGSVPGGGNVSSPLAAHLAPLVESKVKPLSRARKLALALKACKHKRGKKRRQCEAQARKTYHRKSAVGMKGNG
jgi:hypothetical protein